MRRFKTTPQKKFLGMVILFVLVPLFLLLYALFVIDWQPGLDTIVIAAAIAVLFYYLYRKYRKQPAEGAAAEPAAEELGGESQQELEEELPGGEAEEEIPKAEVGKIK